MFLFFSEAFSFFFGGVFLLRNSVIKGFFVYGVLFNGVCFKGFVLEGLLFPSVLRRGRPFQMDSLKKQGLG